MSEERNLRKNRVGIVVSDKMDKTVVIAIEVLEIINTIVIRICGDISGAHFDTIRDSITVAIFRINVS